MPPHPARTERPVSLRMLEAVVFAVLFQLSAILFLLTWPAFFVAPLSPDAVLSMSAFAGLSLPFVALLWFLVGSIHDKLTWFTILTIGTLTAVIPCALILFLTTGLEFFAIAFILPGALPLGIAATWIFEFSRRRLLEKYYAP